MIRRLRRFSQRLICVGLLAGCAGPVARVHHTAVALAPSGAAVQAEIARAQAANERASDDAARVDAKATVVLKWLEGRRR